jgi:hypothetical protein
MRKLILLVAACAAVTLWGVAPSQAYDEGPWCAVVNTGKGSVAERCHFRSFEACRQEVISGNRGFCNMNPRWPGYYASPEPRRRAHRKRTRR